MKPSLVLRPGVGDNVPTAQLFYGTNAIEVLRSLPADSIHCAVTSPPYYGMRFYKGAEPQMWGDDPECPHEWVDSSVTRKGSTQGRPDTHSTLVSTGAPKTIAAGQDNTVGITKQYRKDASMTCSKCGAWLGHLGLEPTYQAYVVHLLLVLAEVWRVLRPDGVFWLNLGDSYANDAKWGGRTEGKHALALHGDTSIGRTRRQTGLKPKNLIGIPWRVAFALQDAGWTLRAEVIWKKLNPCPESVKDRPSRSHEQVFLLTKSAQYHYDYWSVREKCQSGPADLRKMTEQKARIGGKTLTVSDPRYKVSSKTNIGKKRGVGDPTGRNLRSVWDIPTVPYSAAHFACFPPRLAEVMIKAGTSRKGCCVVCGKPRLRSHKKAAWEMKCRCGETATTPCTVLDPFSGSGTAGAVALKLGCHFIGIDICGKYLNLARNRIQGFKGYSRKKANTVDMPDLLTGPNFTKGGDNDE